MELSTKDFHVLDALDSYEITTQRQLSEKSGISLGLVNYLLKRFLKKDLVKMKPNQGYPPLPPCNNRIYYVNLFA